MFAPYFTIFEHIMHSLYTKYVAKKELFVITSKSVDKLTLLNSLSNFISSNKKSIFFYIKLITSTTTPKTTLQNKRCCKSTAQNPPCLLVAHAFSTYNSHKNGGTL